MQLTQRQVIGTGLWDVANCGFIKLLFSLCHRITGWLGLERILRSSGSSPPRKMGGMYMYTCTSAQMLLSGTGLSPVLCPSIVDVFPYLFEVFSELLKLFPLSISFQCQQPLKSRRKKQPTPQKKPNSETLHYFIQ